MFSDNSTSFNICLYLSVLSFAQHPILLVVQIAFKGMVIQTGLMQSSGFSEIIPYFEIHFQILQRLLHIKMQLLSILNTLASGVEAALDSL